MKGQIEVEILIPFNHGQKKGDIRLMKKESAINYEKEGVVKIISSKTKEIATIPKKEVKIKKVESKFEIKYEKLNIHPISLILKRNIGSFVEIFAGDDKKKGGFPKSSYFKVEESNFDKIISEAETLNFGDNGVFYNINPLKTNKRNKENITKIHNIFIDLDDGATQEDNELVLTALNEFKISYYYNALSGHGYHILVPVDLEANNTNLVKGFLTYLKENICNKIDVATHTNERLMRFPESWHNKDAESKQLKTLMIREPTLEEIKLNTENILKYQLEQKKGSRDLQYEQTIIKEDIFFSEILNNSQQWANYYVYLNKAKNRNDFFIKHLGNFLILNPTYTMRAEAFLNNWEPSRILAMQGWMKTAKQQNYTLNYNELLNWAKENKIDEWVVLLEKQTKSTFLDNYEVYFLEDEKPENAYLLYYPQKNYYVQKALNDLLMTIYYDCKETGVDLVKELDYNLLDGWDDLSFKKQYEAFLRGIHKKLDKENRIKKVYNINYEPSEDKFIYLNGKRYFNTYVPTVLWNYNKPSEIYSFPAIKELLMNLTGEDEKNYNYLNKWLAWQIQHPKEKLPTAIILQGRQGSGKGTFKNLILDKIFGENCIEINQTHLESTFNEYLLGKQIIVANEVMHNENRQILPNVLKNLVTDNKITISRKFKKEVTCNNYTHWVFCTNNDNPLKIDVDDRRYNVFYSEKLKPHVVKQLIINLEHEIKEYISYLKSIKVEFEEVSEPIMTDAKAEIIELNKDSVDKFYEYLQQFGGDIFAVFSSLNLDNEYHIKKTDIGEHLIITDKIYNLYDKWAEKHKEKGVFNKQNFSKRLSSKGCKSIVKWDGAKCFKMYNLENIQQLAIRK